MAEARTGDSSPLNRADGVVEIYAGPEVDRIGMTFSCLPPKPLVIKRIMPNSIAAKSGVEVGDTCLSINKKRVEDMTGDQFHEAMKNRPLSISVARSKHDVHIDVVAKELQAVTHGSDEKALLEWIDRGQQAGVCDEIIEQARQKLATLQKEKNMLKTTANAIEALNSLLQSLKSNDEKALSDAINKVAKESKEALELAKAKLADLREQVSQNKRKNLLDEYAIDDKLGEGTYGVVYSCRSKTTGKELAVKMVDKVESPLELIMEEVNMLEQLSHPNVVKFVDVVYEKCFVCIVMDKYAGGNLVVCMLKHWKTKGKLSERKSKPICRQMADSIAYLHGKMIVHRDVKGDNYLTTVEDLTDPSNMIILSDFGTAVGIRPGERLHDSCGTKAYWSPEFYDRDYSLKVDVWAVGVIVFAMLDGRFPFQDEAEVRNSFLKLPASLSQTAEQFIRGSLLRDEAKRFSGEQMANHAFLKSGSAADKTSEKEMAQHEEPTKEVQFKGDVENIFEGDVQEDIAERRDELVVRLKTWYDWFAGEETQTEANNSQKRRRSSQGAKDAKDARKSRVNMQFIQGDVWSPTFQLQKGVGGAVNHFEWWDPEKAEQEMLIKVDDAQPLQDEQADAEIVGRMLTDHGIDTAPFGRGQAKTLDHLAGEVHAGVARLMLDATQHKKLVRVVDVVLVRIVHCEDDQDDSDERYLIEQSERYPDGRKRQAYRLPGTKKLPHESTRETVLRLVKTLGIKKKSLDFDWGTEVFEDSAESPSYPGVTTVYRKEIVEAKVETTDEEELRPLGLTGANQFHIEDKGNTKFYEWMSGQQCERKHVEVYPSGCNDISVLVQAPIGFKEEELRTFLLSGNVDVSKFGDGHTKTLKQFSQELIKGEASLMQDKDGNVLRVVDIVVLRIINSETGAILVQTKQVHTDGTEDLRNRFPGHKRRPDENQFIAVRRVLVQELHIDENCIHIDVAGITVLEEETFSPSYPDLRTLYRKRIINVTLIKL